MQLRGVIAFLAAAVAATQAQIEVSAAEKGVLVRDLLAWKASNAAVVAKEMGLYPTQDNHESTQGFTNDELQRFANSKKIVEHLRKEQPNAVFSLDGPFALLTTDEFKAYVARGFRDQEDLASLANESTTMDADDNDVPYGVDWTQSGCLAPVKNQGKCGSCTYFSATAAVESANCIHTGELVLFSEQRTLSCFGNGCRGGLAVNNLEWIKENGMCRAEDWPYTSGKSQDNGECTANKCKPELLPISEVVRVAKNEGALKKALVDRPVAVSVSAGNDYWRFYKGGIIEECGKGGTDHSVLAVGYNNDDGDYWKIKNSWGPTWGEEGFVRLRRGNAGPDNQGTCRLFYRNPSFPLFSTE
ncbi:TPA: hypothetical protein N0F65_009053 [Lagenidium giganteum]|uniref:Peptidase C1A papain C-terminal domain-containing protein n=1 Tax=Lagenidium giganteum TaxID=4803 RepID=A0AAV2YIG7_9STRA|nr:TPA: hypothetical protein N0F65_009053 [Lagenidium giganteum]